MHQCSAFGLEQGLTEEDVCLGRGRIRLQEIALVVDDRIDLFGRNELEHRNLVLLRCRKLVEILVGEHDSVAVGGVVGLVDVRELHGIAAFGTDSVVLDPSAVLGMHLVESDVVRFRRRIDLDGDVDEAEGDRTLPNGTHGTHDSREATEMSTFVPRFPFPMRVRAIARRAAVGNDGNILVIA